ncbi:Pkinase-domain-containing protein [Serendipita vermifera]|nr:Pkinase-domain-containing protein [Serendipita vermifera]
MNGVLDEHRPGQLERQEEQHHYQQQQDGLRPAPTSSSRHHHSSNNHHHHQQQQAQGGLAPSSSHRRRDHPPEPAFDIRQHPAAIAYAASHPNRTIPKFGPYILLQTLGEGEFGKVKLGLHSHWAEEVAVKLIRRGNVESDLRMQKIRREIKVLEVRIGLLFSLHHPNIVRLYETIETDKYIGIILDYASGGELFDHILAHRYLREKDAKKLFAQLISAVWYIHQKKIVHRDLKLENLLLDRNRNIIVTDFGFANQFEHKADDLMQTSCGSPCYAAPELVISEGLYVGSAVDVWSCGVILYAMLAGYLPFDDDPENPEGDNIQQLYRYILNTPLTFPDHVSTEARDLLLKMLVPDPTHRSTLKTVMEHPWLQQYAHLFAFSVDECEKQSRELQEVKKHQYRKQMREREKEMARAARAQAQRREHHQTHHIEPSSSSRDGRADRLYDPSAPQAGSGAGGYSSQDGGPGRTGRRAVASAIVMPSSPPEDDHPLGVSTTDERYHDAFAAVPPAVASNTNAAAATATSAVSGDALYAQGDAVSSQAPRDRKASTKSQSKKKVPGTGDSAASPTSPNGASAAGGSGQKSSKKAGGFRHTIQVEYDDGGEVQPAPPTPPRPSSRSQRAAAEQQKIELDMANLNLNGNMMEGEAYFTPSVVSDPAKQSPTKTRRSSTTQRPAIPIPAVPAIPPGTYASTGRRGSNASPVLTRNPATDPGMGLGYEESQSSAAITPLHSPPIDQDPPFGKSQEKSSRPASASGKRHTRGMSIERIVEFSKLLTGHGKDTSNASPAGNGDASSSTSPVLSKRASGFGKRPSSRAGRKGSEIMSPTPVPATNASNGAVDALESKSSIQTPTSPGEGSTTPVGVPATPTTPGGSTNPDVSMSESTGSTKASGKMLTGRALSLMVDPISKMKERSKNRTSVTVGADESKEEKSHRKAKGISVPLSNPIDTPGSSTPSSLKHEHTGTQKHSSSGWRLPLFREPSQKGHSREATTKQLPPAPVPMPTLSPNGQEMDPYHMTTNMNGMAPTGATNKSQTVMDWFRKKSLAKERRRTGSTAEPPTAPIVPMPYADNIEKEIEREAVREGDRAKTPTPSDAQEEAKTPTRGSFKKGRQNRNTPSVIVTAAAEPINGSGSESRQESLHSSSTTPSRIDRVVGAIKNVTHTPPAVPVHFTKHRSANASSGGSFGGSSSGGASYNKVTLRLHDGPVDPSTLSSAPPQEIIIQVLEVLKALGIEYSKDSEFKYRCVRPKRRKHAGREASSSGAGPSSNGVDKKGLQSSSSGHVFSRFIMRRSSSQAPPPNFSAQPSMPMEEDAIDIDTPDVEGHGAESSKQPHEETRPKIEPIYGDKLDQHDEVRFSIEVTRIDRLDDLLSLDIRRLKGNLKSYKFLYDIIREYVHFPRI